MSRFDLKEKIIVASFVFITIIVLWLISPMGKLYLPMDTEPLEKSLSFKIPTGYTLKSFNKSYDAEIYNLYNEIYNPHVVTIIILRNVTLNIGDISFKNSNIPSINEFWGSTGFEDVQIFNCNKSLIKHVPVTLCRFKAVKPNLNHKTRKEGQIALFKKASKDVFILNVASELAYNKIVLKDLLRRILTNKRL